MEGAGADVVAEGAAVGMELEATGSGGCTADVWTPAAEEESILSAEYCCVYCNGSSAKIWMASSVSFVSCRRGC